jgi:transposase
MQVHFIKNIQFTRLVKAEGRLREFNFRKFSGEEGELLFSIDVVDDRGNRIIFRMHKDGQVWKILPGQFPPWVMVNENNFHELIEEELRQAS